jgi:predicted outer membrane protein
VLPEDQQTLSDSLEDLVDVPGITVDTEVDLSNKQAQRVQDGVQQCLDESV